MAGGELWGSEHGPRGGDEINLLLPGRKLFAFLDRKQAAS